MSREYIQHVPDRPHSPPDLPEPQEVTDGQVDQWIAEDLIKHPEIEPWSHFRCNTEKSWRMLSLLIADALLRQSMVDYAALGKHVTDMKREADREYAEAELRRAG